MRVSTRRLPMPADALDHQILNRTQQLGLRRHRQLRHFVEKQRSAVGVLELAAPPANAGRRALLDPEQLGLDERFDQRRAVDRDERALPAPTELVDLPRHEFLASAAFAFNQRREIGRGHALDHARAALASPGSIRSAARRRRGWRLPDGSVHARRRARLRAARSRDSPRPRAADRSSRRCRARARTTPRARDADWDRPPESQTRRSRARESAGRRESLVLTAAR